MKQPISILPAIALRGTTILPDMIVHFDVSRERSIKAIAVSYTHLGRLYSILLVHCPLLQDYLECRLRLHFVLEQIFLEQLIL